MHFASFKVVSIKDLNQDRGHLSFLWTLAQEKDESSTSLLVAAGTTKMASHEQCFATHSAAKILSCDQDF